MSGRALELCLKEIDRTRPFFIGLVGDRYGWCPESEEVSFHDEDLQSSIIDDLNERLSITEIEMRYGALRHPEKVKSLFFLKDGEAEERAMQLKQAIRNTPGIRYMDYHDCSDSDNGLGTIAYDNLFSLFRKTFEKKDEEDTNELQLNFANYLASRLEYFIDPPHEGAYDMLLKLPATANAGILAVTGGLGKTTQIAKAICSYAPDVSTHYYGIGVANAQVEAEFICSELSKSILMDFPELNNGSTADDIPSLQTIVTRWQPGRRLIIFIDNLDALGEKDSRLDWLPDFGEGVSVVLGVNDIDRFAEAFNRLGVKVATPALLPTDGMQTMIVRSLAKVGKVLPADILDKMISWPLGRNLKIMSTFLSLISTFGVFEEFSGFVESLIATDSSDTFYRRLLEITEQRHPNVPIRKILGLLCVSRYGLREYQIHDMLELTYDDTSEFIAEFTPFINKAHYRLIINDEQLRTSILEDYMRDEVLELRALLVKGMCEWNNTLKAALISANEGNSHLICWVYDDTIGYEKIDNHVDFLELAHQAVAVNDDNALYAAMLYLGTFESMLERDPKQLLQNWRKLISIGRNLDVYLNSVGIMANNKADGARIYYKIGRWIEENFEDISLASSFYLGSLSVYENHSEFDTSGRYIDMLRRMARIKRAQGESLEADYYLARIPEFDMVKCAGIFLKMARKRESYSERIKDYQRAIDIYRNLNETDSLRYGASLGRTLWEYGSFMLYSAAESYWKEGAKILEEAIILLRTAYECDPSYGITLADVLYTYADSLDASNTQYEKTLGIYKEILDLVPNGSERWIDALNGIAGCHYTLDNYKELKDTACKMSNNKFLAIGWKFTVAFAENGVNAQFEHFDEFLHYCYNPVIRSNHFWNAVNLVTDRLEKMFEYCINSSESSLKACSGEVAEKITKIYSAIGRIDKVEYYHILVGHSSDDSRAGAFLLNANTYMACKRYEDAIRNADYAADIYHKLVDSDSRFFHQLWETYKLRADVLLAKGNNSKAEDMVERGLKILWNAYEVDSSLTSLLGQAMCYKIEVERQGYPSLKYDPYSNFFKNNYDELVDLMPEGSHEWCVGRIGQIWCMLIETRYRDIIKAAPQLCAILERERNWNGLIFVLGCLSTSYRKSVHEEADIISTFKAIERILPYVDSFSLEFCKIIEFISYDLREYLGVPKESKRELGQFWLTINEMRADCCKQLSSPGLYLAERYLDMARQWMGEL